jgi:hypothetical protein
VVFQGYRQGIIAFKTNNEIDDLFTLISLIVHQMKSTASVLISSFG